MDSHLSHPTLAASVGLWLVMVVAMMAPVALPWARAYAVWLAPASTSAAWVRATPFVAGYAIVWALYSVTMALTQATLSAVGAMTGDRVGVVAGSAVLAAAGAFQFSRLKAACLTHCRNPLSFFLARWQDGPTGGLRLGLAHGVYCLGCCWLLMATGFALGVMNLAWMAAVTAIVVVEQLAPGGHLVGRAFGVVLVGWAGWRLW